MTFKSKSFKKVEDKKFKIRGEITIRGVKKTIELDAISNGEATLLSESDYFSFSVTGLLPRGEFGINWDLEMKPRFL